MEFKYHQTSSKFKAKSGSRIEASLKVFSKKKIFKKKICLLICMVYNCYKKKEILYEKESPLPPFSRLNRTESFS